MIETRTTESMKTNFITCPGDVFVIKGHSRCITDSITVAITNTDRDEHFYINLRNILAAWKMLKQLDDMGGRSVFDQLDDNDPIPYKDSTPYKARFAV